MASFTRQLDVERRGDDFILKYVLDTSASPLAKAPVFKVLEIAKPEDANRSYMRVQPAEMRSQSLPNQFGFEWKLNPDTLKVNIKVYSELGDQEVDNPANLLWQDVDEDLTVNSVLNKGSTRLRVRPAGQADSAGPTDAAAGPTPNSSARMLSVFHSARRVMEEGYKAYGAPKPPDGKGAGEWADANNRSQPGSDLVDRIERTLGSGPNEWCGMFVGYNYGKAGFDLRAPVTLPAVPPKLPKADLLSGIGSIKAAAFWSTLKLKLYWDNFYNRQQAIKALVAADPNFKPPPDYEPDYPKPITFPLRPGYHKVPKKAGSIDYLLIRDSIDNSWGPDKCRAWLNDNLKDFGGGFQTGDILLVTTHQGDGNYHFNAHVAMIAGYDHPSPDKYWLVTYEGNYANNRAGAAWWDLTDPGVADADPSKDLPFNGFFRINYAGRMPKCDFTNDATVASDDASPSPFLDPHPTIAGVAH